MFKIAVLLAVSVFGSAYSFFNLGYQKGYNTGLEAGFSSGSRVEGAKQAKALEGCETVASNLLQETREAEAKIKKYEELFSNLESVFGQ